MKRFPSRHAILPAVVLSVLGAANPAAAVTYSEFTQGDLTNQGLLTTLSLDDGINLVFGNVSVRGSDGVDAVVDWDAFAFSVAPDQQLVSISVQLWETAGNLNYVRWSLWEANSPLVYDATQTDVSLKIFSPGIESVGGSWGAGLYQFLPSVIGWQPPLGAADYRMELVVREVIPAVPEPGTWALALAGVGFLAARRAGRRTAP